MNPKPTHFMIAVGIACFLTGFLTKQVGDNLMNGLQEPPTGMIGVTILEHNKNSEGKTWTLLETEDGQRCFTYHYRGNPGDKFFMWPEDISGYRSPDAVMELTLNKAQIDLSKEKPTPETEPMPDKAE